MGPVLRGPVTVTREPPRPCPGPLPVGPDRPHAEVVSEQSERGLSGPGAQPPGAASTSVDREAGTGYAPALDGLRALAVAGVLAYHAGVDAIPGGFLGVDVFLVLSGYLITTLLLAEWRRVGGVRLMHFWERRFRRLAPALAIVVAAVVAHAALTGTVAAVRGDALATLSWVQNWHLALGRASYFAVFGEASPLRHAWSLALEAQWYLLWPPLLLLGLRIAGGRPRALGGVALGLAAASALAMWTGFDPGADPSRIYYGTDTRAQGLLVGAAFALLLVGRPQRRAWTLAGMAGAAALVAAAAGLADLDPRLYRGGFLLVALATAAVLGAALREGWAARALACEPLPWLGRISYGIYLWHWPLYLWLGPSIAAVALTVGAASASYLLIETPVRRARPNRRRLALGLSLGSIGALAVAVTALPGVTVRAVAPGSAVAVASPAPPTTGGATADRSVSRVLVAGDSVAWTLAERFDPSWVGIAFEVDYRATHLGCGIVAGQPLNAGRPIMWADPDCEEWERRWADGLAGFTPDVVVILLGAWEVLDHRVDGRTLEAGSRPAEDYLRPRLDRGIEMVVDAGARPVLLTAPCYRPEDEPPDRSTSDRGDDERVAWFNGVVRDAAAAHPGTMIIDLNRLLCPGGGYADEIGGTPARTDGVHLTVDAARQVWAWLAPQLSAK